MQIEYTALMPEGNYSHYIVHPYQIGATNIIINAKVKGTNSNATVMVAVYDNKKKMIYYMAFENFYLFILGGLRL